jgi:DNA polymerase III subunit delta
MKQSPEAVIKDLKAGKFAPVYFLQGEESFYIDQVADYIENHALPEHERGFNQVILYGKDVDFAAVLNNARRYPMMAERQVVIVKEAQEIQDFKKEDKIAMLMAYLKEPLASTILVFCHKHKSLDKRKSISKTIYEHAVVVESGKIYDNKLPDFIESYVASRGRKIDIAATRVIAEYIGNNLDRISGEINKILINLKEDEKISEAHVQRYVGISKEYNVFELQKAVGFLEVEKAFRIVNFFAANPKNYPAIPVIVTLFTYFNKIVLFHRSSSKGDKDLSSLLGINPFFLKEYRIAADKHPIAKTLQNIHYLREADLQSKGITTSNMTDGEILKELVYKLMH